MVRHVATRPTASLAESDLVQMMIGRPLANIFRDTPMRRRARRRCASRG
jgi:ABC-type sugar transport system ATPase subunit